MAVVKKLMRQGLKLAERFPWVIPLFGFVSGVASFFLVERRQDQFAQIISALMLGCWLWLAIEPLLRRSIAHWFGVQMPAVVLRYVSQLVHQESLFFVVPFFFITTAWNTGQLVFTSLLILAAIISLIDPLYYNWLAPRRWLYFTFHGITLFAVLLTALPLIFHLSTSKSYLWALAIAALLTCPGVARDMTPNWWKRAAVFIGLLLISGAAGLLTRPWIPPASIWLTQVAITDHIEKRQILSDKPLKTLTTAQLAQGVYAYTAIHAPRGLRERIYHQWRYKGKKFDKIALNISGGREEGYRSWSHKRNFPAQAAGDWQIEVLTETNQVIGILRFKVVDAPIQHTK